MVAGRPKQTKYASIQVPRPDAFICHFYRMTFATSHLASSAGELHKSRDNTGDFTLTCQGKVIKAHSFILSMGLVLRQMYVLVK